MCKQSLGFRDTNADAMTSFARHTTTDERTDGRTDGRRARSREDMSTAVTKTLISARVAKTSDGRVAKKTAVTEARGTGRGAADACVVAALAVTLATARPAMAEIRLPPIDTDPNRCERAFVGNTIGQANAVSDKVLDLRKCSYEDADLSTKTLSGALMVNTIAKGANMRETVMSKVYAPDANFSGADFTNAVIDRATFDGSDMTGANFTNSVVTGVSFEEVDLTNADFTDALIGKEDAKRLCENPTVKDETRMQVGCRT